MMAVLAAASAAMLCAGVAGLVVRPMARLAPRVRPYSVIARVELGRGADRAAVATATGVLGDGIVGRLFGPPLVACTRRLGRIIERQGDDVLTLRLRQAGIRATPEEYRIRQVGGAVMVSILAFVVGTIGLGPLLGLALAAVAFVGAAARTRAQVDRAIAERAEEIRLQLATVDQLLALQLRAGAGPVQAMQRLVERGHGACIDECADVLRSIRAGLPEPDAFRRAAQLTSEPAAARTFALFAAAAERGADLAAALLDLANDLRDARRDDLRATATKRRAAMLIPTIAILAPIMLLFIAAPIPTMVLGTN
jgi:tight adherence protein C